MQQQERLARRWQGHCVGAQRSSTARSWCGTRRCSLLNFPHSSLYINCAPPAVECSSAACGRSDAAVTSSTARAAGPQRRYLQDPAGMVCCERQRAPRQRRVVLPPPLAAAAAAVALLLLLLAPLAAGQSCNEPNHLVTSSDASCRTYCTGLAARAGVTADPRTYEGEACLHLWCMHARSPFGFCPGSVPHPPAFSLADAIQNVGLKERCLSHSSAAFIIQSRWHNNPTALLSCAGPRGQLCCACNFIFPSPAQPPPPLAASPPPVSFPSPPRPPSPPSPAPVVVLQSPPPRSPSAPPPTTFPPAFSPPLASVAPSPPPPIILLPPPPPPSPALSPPPEPVEAPPPPAPRPLLEFPPPPRPKPKSPPPPPKSPPPSQPSPPPPRSPPPHPPPQPPSSPAGSPATTSPPPPSPPDGQAQTQGGSAPPSSDSSGSGLDKGYIIGMSVGGAVVMSSLAGRQLKMVPVAGCLGELAGG